MTGTQAEGPLSRLRRLDALRSDAVSRPSPPAIPAALGEILVDARRRGYLGPGPVELHIGHSLAFAHAGVPAPANALDLGSGAGVPGLVLAFIWGSTEWVLLEGSTRRAGFLHEAIERLGLSPRVRVIADRAERYGRGPQRGSFAVVTARAFGSPGVTAECASPLLCVGGHLIVAEPPAGKPARWSAIGLAGLGLVDERTISEPVALQVLRQAEPAPTLYPRRVGIPAKRPLF